jgi:large subunit ribosomal protein L9
VRQKIAEFAMQIILLEDVNKLGDMGDVIDVKPGYARNYLIPQGLALRASTGNVSQLKHQKRTIESRKERLRAEALEILHQVDKVSVTIPKKSGEKDKLFGSVTNRDIATALGHEGHSVNPKKILLDNPIKELGIFKVRVKLHSDIVANVMVWVVAL